MIEVSAVTLSFVGRLQWPLLTHINKWLEVWSYLEVFAALKESVDCKVMLYKI